MLFMLENGHKVSGLLQSDFGLIMENNYSGCFDMPHIFYVLRLVGLSNKMPYDNCKLKH